MPPKSPLWNYFHSNKTHYKGNKSHLNAWCKACVAAHTRRQEVESQETSDLPRSKQEMFDEADHLNEHARVLVALPQSYIIRTHNMTGEPKTGDRLLELVLDDIEYMVDKYGVKVIAWCTDDGPDGKKMRRLLLRRFPWIMVLVCWAHQINLVVGDFLTLKYDLLLVIVECLEVIKWFNNHSAALALLEQEMKFTYDGKAWALILPVITRWTAHYLSTTRLLKVKGAAILEPLAIAANITQASDTRLDHVLLTLGNFSLEKRWDKADQDIFILAVFFNPFIRSHLFQPNALTESQLHSIVEAVFKRFFSRAGDVPLMRAFTDYVREQGEFSRDAMQLDRMKEMFEGEAVTPSSSSLFAFLHLFPIPHFGQVHTKYRNKLKAEQVHKIGVVKMDIRRKNIAEGLVRNRKKCKFGDMDLDSPDSTDSSPSTDPTDFLTLGRSLIDDAANNNIEPVLNPDSNPTTSSAPSLPQGRPKKIPLEKLFNYGTVAETLRGTGLDFYWKGGIRNIEEELERCDNDGTNDVNLSSNLPAGADLNVDI
ncbi:ribonuclease H-like domain-containing protein [Lyophyllum atratum]|nr:ribonuclease H-like domain-containing protein [Lyophyllum atratum]